MKKINAILPLLLLVTIAVAQPTAPSYNSSTAYIIWYDAYMRNADIKRNQGYSSGGGGGGSSSGGFSNSYSRLERKLAKYRMEEEKRNAVQSKINQLNSDAQKTFWQSVEYFEKGDYTNTFALYIKYKELLQKEVAAFTKNNVMPTNYDNTLDTYHQYSYEFLINMKQGDYTTAMFDIGMMLPYKPGIGSYDQFPTGTVKYFRNEKQITTCPDIRSYLGVVQLLGRFNICKDGRDILDKLSPALKDSINKDYAMMIEYAMTQASVRDYTGAIKTLNEVISEENDPVLTNAIAGELKSLVLGNRSHGKQIVQYIYSLYDSVKQQTADKDLAANAESSKNSMEQAFAPPVRNANCSTLPVLNEERRYGAYINAPLETWALQMAACGHFETVKNYLQTKIDSAAAKKKYLTIFYYGEFPSVEIVAGTLLSSGYDEEAMQLFDMLGASFKKPGLYFDEAQMEVARADLFYRQGDYKNCLMLTDKFIRALRKRTGPNYAPVWGRNAWVIYCKVATLFRMNKPTDAVNTWNELVDNQNNPVGTEASMVAISKYLTTDDVDIILNTVAK